MTEKYFRDMLRQNHKKIISSKKEIAFEISVSESTLDRLRKDIVIKSTKIRGQIMFCIDEKFRLFMKYRSGYYGNY